MLEVDDEPDIAFAFKEGLEGGGFRVNSFNDPQIALFNFKVDAYDIALIDVRMRRMNGIDLCRKLRKIDYKVKYCFMTAYGTYFETLKKDYPILDTGCLVKKPIGTFLG